MTPKQPPWFWRWVRIPFREYVWYPFKRWAYTLRCRFLFWHEWRPGGIMSAHHGKLQICDRCGETEWRLMDNLEEILKDPRLEAFRDGKHECVCVHDGTTVTCGICDGTGRCH